MTITNLHQNKILKLVTKYYLIDLNEGKVITELKAPREITHPLGWQSDGTYQFGEGSPLDIHTVYEYDLKTGCTKKIEE